MGMPRAALPRNLRALSYAIDFVGLGETGGENRGPFVELCLRAANVPIAAPWCAAFVNFCAELGCAIAGERSPLEDVPRQALVQSYVNHGTEAGWIVGSHQAVIGDLFCIKTGRTRRYDHMGFVRGVPLATGGYRTIEGNTTDAGDSEGDGVFERTRRLSFGQPVFLRWW